MTQSVTVAFSDHPLGAALAHAQMHRQDMQAATARLKAARAAGAAAAFEHARDIA